MQRALNRFERARCNSVNDVSQRQHLESLYRVCNDWLSFLVDEATSSEHSN